MALYWLYRDCFWHWGPKEGAFPDWKQITSFSIT
jgi:hypothetical protein